MSKQHPFRFGVLCEQVYAPQELAEKARQAERLGYTTFLVRDHLLHDPFAQEPYGYQLAPLVALMAAAAATQRLHVGTLVLDNDFRHPAMLAKEAATLDLLSGSRFELGIGAGWLRAEYVQAGMSFDAPPVRVSRLEEALRVLKGLFADPTFSFSGEYYTVRGLDGIPRPLQRPPILVGAGGRRMLALAGREADIVSILPRALPDDSGSEEAADRLPAALERKIGWIREGAGARFAEIELSVLFTPRLAEDRRQRAEQLIEENGWQGVSIEDVLEMPTVFIGSAAQMIEQMRQRRERYGLSYLVVPDRYMEAIAPVVAELAGK